MNATPERVCEALEWLTGHKWADNGMEHGKPSFICVDGEQTFVWDSEDGYCLHRGWFKRGIEDELAHALAVTAPWEWDGLYFERRMDDEEKTLIVAACIAVHKLGMKTFYKWRIASDDGPNMDMHADTEEEAKTAARAAYLTWMRGRFAMRGCMA